MHLLRLHTAIIYWSPLPNIADIQDTIWFMIGFMRETAEQHYFSRVYCHTFPYGKVQIIMGGQLVIMTEDTLFFGQGLLP